MALLSIEMIHDGTRDLFWAKVDKRTDDECWPWTGSHGKRGYGYFFAAGDVRKATHVSLALDGRPRESTKDYALHRCDNPNCVNPRHLWWGTQTENMQDASKKGRKDGLKGEESPNAKITVDVVLAIRASDLGCVALSKRFGISPSHVNNIRKRRMWRHV